MDRDRIFGGNPLGVAIRLALISIVVGIVMSALDIGPRNILDHVRLLAHRIWSMGFGAVEALLGYLLLGAAVVVPIWLVARLIAAFRKRA